MQRDSTPFTLAACRRAAAPFALAALALALTACAAPPPAAQAPAASSPAATATTAQRPASADAAQQFTLANGMTLIVKPDRRAPTAVHMLWVRVGSVDEVSGTTGVAHVLEHMMFKGTDTLPPGEFSRRVAELGGRENAFTNRDYTGYYQQVPANRLADVMALEADRFAHNRWSDEEFGIVLAVILDVCRLRSED